MYTQWSTTLIQAKRPELYTIYLEQVRPLLYSVSVLVEF